MHLRLGRFPFASLKYIDPSLVLDNITSCICQVCPAARQTRLPFSHSSIKTSRIFQLIHVNLWGPYKLTTHTGCKMFVTIVDDYSRHTWVFMIKHKSDVIQILQDFFTYTHTHFQCLVECVRSDNAKELCEGKMMQYYLQHGIIHQKSCTETPQ